jgi:hypothetical protein
MARLDSCQSQSAQNQAARPTTAPSPGGRCSQRGGAVGQKCSKSMPRGKWKYSWRFRKPPSTGSHRWPGDDHLSHAAGRVGQRPYFLHRFRRRSGQCLSSQSGTDGSRMKKVKPGMTAEATLTTDTKTGARLPGSAPGHPACQGSEPGVAFVYDPRTSTVKKTPVRCLVAQKKCQARDRGPRALPPGTSLPWPGVSFLADGMSK